MARKHWAVVPRNLFRWCLFIDPFSVFVAMRIDLPYKLKIDLRDSSWKKGSLRCTADMAIKMEVYRVRIVGQGVNLGPLF